MLSRKELYTTQHIYQTITRHHPFCITILAVYKKQEKKFLSNSHPRSGSVSKKWQRSRKGRRVYNKILLPLKRDSRIFNNPDGRPEPTTLRVNGAKIAIETPSDTLCYLHTINLRFSEKT